MLKAAFSGVVALGLMVAAASAQDVDCGKAYTSALEKIERETEGRLSPERRAALRRQALRVYNACGTGHLRDPKALFEQLDRAKE